VKGPLLAFAELRARLFWRRIRGRGGVVELVSRIVLFALVIPSGLVFAGLAGAGAWQAVRVGHGVHARIAVTALLFGVWQTWTAVSLSVSERDAVDLRRFLGYPIPPGRIFLYGLAASVVADPFAVFWMLILGGAFVGAAAARPGAWALLLALAYALFVAGTASLVALLQELLARLLRGRRLREVGIAAVYVGGAFLVFFMASGRSGAMGALRALALVRWLAFPAALGERAITALYGRDPAVALAWIAGLLAATVAAAWTAFRLALAGALSGAAQGARTAAAAGSGWRIPGRLAPLIEKEGKYVVRHPVALVLALVVPAFAALVAWRISPLIPAEAGDVVRALPLFGFAAYAHLATQPFWLNAFGWERGGGRAWFLAPVAPGDVLVAKNVTAYLLSLALFVASAAAGILVGGRPPAWAVVGAAALHAGMAPFFLAAGNVISIVNPRPAPYTVQRGGHLSPISVLAGMAVFAAGSALFAVPVLVAIRLDRAWVLPGGFAVLGLLGVAAYRAALPRAARLLAARREPLLEAICGDDV
jgi:ABC-2 type transport system permease protein